MMSGSATAPLLSARLLGEFRVSVNGRPIGPQDWHHGSAERLLKLLLVTPSHRLRREVASEGLWPEASPDRAGANLRRAIHYLRRALDGDGPLCTLGVGHRDVGFGTHVRLAVDLDALVAASHRVSVALGVDRPSFGDLRQDLETVVRLGAFELLPDDLTEEWSIRLREQLLVRWERAAILLAEQSIAAGRPGRAHHVAEQVLDRDPASEEAHRLTIQALMLEGLPHAARRQLAICRRMLADAFGVEPSPETVAALVPRKPITVGGRLVPTLSAETQPS